MPILTVETLHGPPSLGGRLYPNANFDSPVEGRAVDLSRYKTMQDGTVKKVGAERYRLRWTLGWKALDEVDMHALIETLEQREGFTFKPRTIKAGTDTDPSAVESEYTVRCISELPLTRKLVHEDYDIVVELETVGILTG